MNMSLDELYSVFRQRVADRKYDLAEVTMRQILDVPGQPPEQYLYLPTGFYEEWGDYETGSSDLAATYYEQALEYRVLIGHQATGSGEGLAAMYHIKRVRKKLENSRKS